MYRVEILFPQHRVFSRDFGTAREALDCYEIVRFGTDLECVEVLILGITHTPIEPHTLAECLMEWGRADRLRK